VRGSLLIPAGQPVLLVDASGRRRAVLKPGRNDVRGYAPGVYFVLREPGARAKVIFAR
jgi:hypothetical protein